MVFGSSLPRWSATANKLSPGARALVAHVQSAKASRRILQACWLRQRGAKPLRWLVNLYRCSSIISKAIIFPPNRCPAGLAAVEWTPWRIVRQDRGGRGQAAVASAILALTRACARTASWATITVSDDMGLTQPAATSEPILWRLPSSLEPAPMTLDGKGGVSKTATLLCDA